MLGRSAAGGDSRGAALPPVLTRGGLRPPRSVCARHGRVPGGGSPPGEEVMPTLSRRQRRRREAGSGGSPRRNPAPRDAKRVGGVAIWVSRPHTAKPVITKTAAT